MSSIEGFTIGQVDGKCWYPMESPVQKLGSLQSISLAMQKICFKALYLTVRFRYTDKVLQGQSSDIVKKQIDQETKQLAQAGIYLDSLKNIQIPFPPLEEQRHIAAILEEADHARRIRHYTQQQSDAWLQSVFVEMFGDPVTNPMGWEVNGLGTLCSTIIDCPHETPIYADDVTPYPCMRSSDIQNGYFDWSTTKYLEFNEYIKRIEMGTPQPGDVFFCREGARFGNAARNLGNEQVCLGQRMLLFRANPEAATSEFLWAFLQSKSVYSQIYRLVRGSASPHVNIQDLKKLEVIQPNLPFSKKFLILSTNMTTLAKNKLNLHSRRNISFKACWIGRFRGSCKR